jgi:ATP synthase protein I
VSETESDEARQDRERLEALNRDIQAAQSRTQGETPDRSVREASQGMSLAWRVVTELVVATLVGGAVGWGVDHVSGFGPLGLIVGVILGFVAGLRLAYKAATQASIVPPPPGDDAMER